MKESKKKTDGSFLETLNLFAQALASSSPKGSFSLFPAPSHGSACKRPFLFLRWLSRSDPVDPGGWSLFSPSDLLLPVDTHIFRFTSAIGLNTPSAPSLSFALRASAFFSSLCPADPIKFDFALSRLGIRNLNLTHYINTQLTFLQ